MGPILFLFFINDLPNIVKSRVKLFADDAKLYSEVRTLDDCLKLQSDLDSLCAWSKNWMISFNKEKCVVLRIRQALQFTYYMDGHPLSVVTEQKDLGVLISNDLKPSKHVSSICNKANQKLGMIHRCFSNHSRAVISPLYKSIVRPIIENSSPAWNPWLQKDINKLDSVQKRCVKLCSNNIEFESLSDRRQKADLKETYKQVHGLYKNPSQLQVAERQYNTRGHSKRLGKEHSRTEIRKTFFTNRVVNTWNNLPESLVTAASTTSFKEGLELVTGW